MSETVIRCPQCGHRVPSFFHHVGINCEHDMTPGQIAELERLAEAQEDTDDAYGH